MGLARWPRTTPQPKMVHSSCPFLSCFLLLVLAASVSASSSVALDHGGGELHVLTKLKLSMIGPGGSGLSDWSSTTADYCSFSGVSCDGRARVVALNVSFLPLFGKLPPEIGLLKDLVNLTLSAVNFIGKLPPEIGNLTNLRVLNISNNNLTGEFPPQVAAGLPNLELLDAYNNNFSGSLPLGLGGLPRLRHLCLGGNYFTGEIPAAFSRIKSLEYLGLNGNWLTGRIPTSIARLSALREMYIGYYNRYEGGIPPELGSMASLVRLDLGGCNLNGQIPSSLGKLKLLDSLFLQLNNLTGAIPPELGDLKNLKSLDLSNNDLVGEIPATFSNLRELTLLNLFRNHLRGPIPSFLADFPNLEVLYLWDNNFTFELPADLGRNGRLTRLDVADNHVTGLIPKGLCDGGKLETLILMDNSLFGPIPEELGQCKSLTRVRLARNFFNGSIPAGLFNLPFNGMLELGDNYLSGELPVNMSGEALAMLLLSNNWVSGKIPPAIGNLVGLQKLSLFSNRMSGEIPSEIGGLKQLSDVNLSKNDIAGPIPPELASCRSLVSVDLSCNNLSGSIPVEITDLENLNILNLSRNRFGGEIPQQIQHMRSLTLLDLSSNNLSGKIPIGVQLSNESSYAANPGLCGGPLPGSPCSSSNYHSYTSAVGSSRRISGTFVSISLAITVAILVSAIAIKFSSWWNAQRMPGRWRMTAFQRLDFTVSDVLECLKDDNIIGKGGAGTVYSGSMPCGTELAIKKLVGKGVGGEQDRGFTAEIQTLGRIRHRNIVRLLGFVTNREVNLLLYEYMPNGSLGEILHGSKAAHLDWYTRYRVALEAAKGLCYLHHDCSPLIVHRDVKSNNILLDSCFEAHVADFGLAKFMAGAGAGASECMSSIAGSYGYIAPEYAYTLRVDEKSDVYSFGVLLLELVTGRRPVGGFGDGVDIVRWVRKTTSEVTGPKGTEVVAVVDGRFAGDRPLERVAHLFRVAMLCVEERSEDRPTMREVVHMLANPVTPQADLVGV